jgi:TP901 family phage tail tape measure protein
MNKKLDIAIILRAVDQASHVIEGAAKRSKKAVDDASGGSLKKAFSAAALMGMAEGMRRVMAQPIQAFSELEDSSVRMQNAMTNNFNQVSPLFEEVKNLTVELGNKLPGTTSDMQKMFEVLLNNGIPAQSVLNGVGESAAYLGLTLNMAYTDAARFAAKMKNATSVADEDMKSFMDTLQRMYNLGADVTEMEFAFGRSGGALKSIGLTGLDAAKDLSAMFAILVRGGLSGEVVGTGFAATIKNLLSTENINNLNKAASNYGIAMSFFDQSGNFKGIDNMIEQFSQLNKLTVQQRANVMYAFSGGGQDTQILMRLIQGGVEGYRDMKKAAEEKMSMDAKMNVQLQTLKMRWEALTGTFVNFLALIGEAMSPLLKMITDLLTGITTFLTQLGPVGQIIFAIIGTIAGLITIVIACTAAWNLWTFAVGMFNATLLAGPIGWFFIAVGLMVSAIIALVAYWDTLVEAFKNGSTNIRIWMALLAGALLYFFWPVLVPILAVVAAIKLLAALWPYVKTFFSSLFNFIFELPGILWDAGANIISSIWDGMKSRWGDFKNWWHSKMQMIRDYLPFSPAKVGPLRDIHRVKFMETLALSLKSDALSKAMNKGMNVAVGSIPKRIAGTAVSSATTSGQTIITYSPVINIGAGADGDKKSFIELLNKHKEELLRMIDEANSRRARRSFS